MRGSIGAKFNRDTLSNEALAAIFCQEVQKGLHPRKINRVNDLATFSPRVQEAAAVELLQMKGQGRWCDSEAFADLSGWQTCRALLDQKPENGKPGFLRKGAERRYGLFLVHRVDHIENPFNLKAFRHFPGTGCTTRDNGSKWPGKWGLGYGILSLRKSKINLGLGLWITDASCRRYWHGTRR